MALAFSIGLVMLSLLAFVKVLNWDASLRSPAVTSCLLASLVGEITFVIQTADFRIHDLLSPALWLALVLYYPLSVIPNGLWAGVIGALSVAVVRRYLSSHQTTRPRLLIWSLVASLLGGCAGFSFLWVSQFVLDGLGETTQNMNSAYPLAGLAAGLVVGFLVPFLAGRSGSLAPDE